MMMRTRVVEVNKWVKGVVGSRVDGGQGVVGSWVWGLGVVMVWEVGSSVDGGLGLWGQRSGSKGVVGVKE